MDITVRCHVDGEKIELNIDTVGDPSVGMEPEGVEQATGDCPHVHRINDTLDTGGEHLLRELMPELMAQVDAEMQEQFRVQAEDAAEAWLLEQEEG